MYEIPKPIKTPEWLHYAAQFPIAFAQVREDPAIDEWLVNHLSQDAQGIMIASGGCTAALLAHTERFSNLTLVDMNPGQLALSRIKLSLVQNSPLQERLELLGYVPMAPSLRRELLETVMGSAYQDPVLGPIEAIESLGLDYIGRYELLFKRLQYELGDLETTKQLLHLHHPMQQKEFLENHPLYLGQLKSAFHNVMALSNLVALFGTEATQNAVKPFEAHFYERTLYALETMPADSNPYLSQLLMGQFVSHTLYPWLTLPSKKTTTKVKYKHLPMGHALLGSPTSFDFIHLSNIMDWLSEEKATALLKVAFEKLNPGGWVIIRQLNSRLQIPDLCKEFTWETETAKLLHKKDRSFFYQKLHIARK